MRTVIAAFCTLIAATPAQAFDPNTADSVAYIEQDEVGFLYFGNRKGRRLAPGIHLKIPLLERVGVIIPEPVRSDSVYLSVPLPTGEVCEIVGWLDYNIADPRRAFDWRRANNLPLKQQRELFKSPHADYTEPAKMVEIAFLDAAQKMTRRQIACSAFQTWHDLGESTLGETIGEDGTQILETGLDETCAHDLHAVIIEAGEQCHQTPRISKSLSSFVRDSPHRIVRHQTHR